MTQVTISLDLPDDVQLYSITYKRNATPKDWLVVVKFWPEGKARRFRFTEGCADTPKEALAICLTNITAILAHYTTAPESIIAQIKISL